MVESRGACQGTEREETAKCGEGLVGYADGRAERGEGKEAGDLIHAGELRGRVWKVALLHGDRVQ